MQKLFYTEAEFILRILKLFKRTMDLAFVTEPKDIVFIKVRNLWIWNQRLFYKTCLAKVNLGSYAWKLDKTRRLLQQLDDFGTWN